MKKQILQVSFSGGRSSAMMCYILKNFKKFDNYHKVFLFANTGKELEETLVFADQVDKLFNLNLIWLESKVYHGERKRTSYNIVDFKTADRYGNPFEEVIIKYGLPSKMYRHCTRELKIKPMESYMIDNYGKDFKTALGMRIDEPSRIKPYDNFVYPLAEVGVNESMVREFWSKMPFDLKLKDYQGNCDLCFLKSTRKKVQVLKENKEISTWWIDMEQKYGGNNQPRFDVVRKYTVEELVKISADSTLFARDKFESGKLSKDMFSIVDDIDFDCFCSNS